MLKQIDCTHCPRTLHMYNSDTQYVQTLQYNSGAIARTSICTCLIMYSHYSTTVTVHVETEWLHTLCYNTNSEYVQQCLYKLQVSFAEYSLFYRALLQKRPIILRSLLIVATPHNTDSEYVPQCLYILKNSACTYWNTVPVHDETQCLYKLK